MSKRIALAVASVAAACSSVSSGAMVTFTNSTLWGMFASSRGAATSPTNFGSYSGTYSSSLTGTSGGVQWVAAADGGVSAGPGFLSAQQGNRLLTLSLSAQVQGIGGNFVANGAPGLVAVPAFVTVALADGSSYVGYAASATDFVGFYSTGAAISSVSISVSGGSASGSYYATIGGLSFAAVPSPGAVSVMGAGMLAAGARRRRR